MSNVFEEREEREAREREAIANFAKDIIMERLGTCLIFSNSITVQKYEMTPNDVVEIVIAANKYGLNSTKIEQRTSHNGMGEAITLFFRP